MKAFEKCNEVKLNSSLLLQITLFINVRFYPIWTISSLYYFSAQIPIITNIEYILTIISMVIAIPVEGFRLYFGYLGNLKEQMSELAGFWILSTFIRLPIQIYLILTKHTIASTPFALIIQCTALALLAIQIVFGFCTHRHFVKVGAKQFHLKRLIEQSS